MINPLETFQSRLSDPAFKHLLEGSAQRYRIPVDDVTDFARVIYMYAAIDALKERTEDTRKHVERLNMVINNT